MSADRPTDDLASARSHFEKAEEDRYPAPELRAAAEGLDVNKEAHEAVEIDVFIRREGHTDPAHHKVENGLTVLALKLLLASGSSDTAGVFIFEEDSDLPLPDHLEIRHHGPGRNRGHKILHHSRCMQVQVAVRYAGRLIERSFGPGSTLSRIKDWAEREFGIDAADAAELSLQLAGSTDRPDESTHVGSLANCPDCSVVVDLLPTVRVNGTRQ